MTTQLTIFKKKEENFMHEFLCVLIPITQEGIRVRGAWYKETIDSLTIHRVVISWLNSEGKLMISGLLSAEFRCDRQYFKWLDTDSQ